MTELQPIIVFHSRHFVRHLGICNRICVNLLQLMSGVITHNSVKKTKVSILTNTELRPIIVFHDRNFVRHLGICNPVCVKLLHVMSGVIPSNLKKTPSPSQTVFLRSTNASYTHTDRQTDTHTHDDSIRRNAMRCISYKNRHLVDILYVDFAKAFDTVCNNKLFYNFVRLV